MATTIKTKKVTKVATLTKNQIAFQRGLLIAPENLDNHALLSKEEQLTIQAELMQFGYMLSESALKLVTIDWYENVLPFLKKNLGIGDYKPFYKNFPQQVMALSDAELFWNAIFHYWSQGTWEPNYLLEEKGIKFEKTKFTTIKLGNENDFQNIFTTLVSINQSITDNDKKIVEWFIANYGEKVVLPKTIPFKETLCMIAGFGIKVPITTATDVLRIAVYFSGGDISLPAVPKVTVSEVRQNRKSYFFNNLRNSQIAAREKFKFKNLSRLKRKYLLSLLEDSSLDLGEMKLRLNRWIRLGEVLHVGEYKNMFPKAYEAFSALRNSPKTIKTYESMLEEAIVYEDLQTMFKLLSQRPGVFARKLDFLLRTFNSKRVLKEFEGVSMKVSKKVLWELYNYYLNRKASGTRSIMIKGNSSKKKVLPALPSMDEKLINNVQTVILNCIAQHFSKLEKLGSVWIDERLKKVPLPSAMRSINASVKTYVRGTRIAFSETAKVVRPYIHWFDEYGHEDLDLSVGFFNENLQMKKHISFTQLRDKELNACHSGDVRCRQGACAEYVDIDINTALSLGMRYAIVQVHNYQNRPMHTLTDCVFGLMEREFPQSNSTFVPKTITNAVKLANESSSVCVAILDLQEREYIWMDLELQSRDLAIIERTSSSTALLIKSIIDNTQLSVYDLLSLHAKSRGTLVVDAEKAQTKFQFDEFVTGYDKVASFM